MPLFGRGASKFEMHLLRDGRWRIESTFAEEADALASAKSMLAARLAEGVKVVKYRPLPGMLLETVVFQSLLPKTKNKPLVLADEGEGAPWCTTLPDLTGFPARSVIGRMLRMFLDRHHITTTELLHGWPYARALDEQAALLGAAIHAVARHQSQTSGTPHATRARELRILADAAVARARDGAAVLRRLPAFNPAQPGESLDRLERSGEGADAEFLFLVQVTDHMTGMPSLAGRLETLTAMMERCTAHLPGPLIEGAMADALESAEVVKDILGHQHHLAGGLAALADALTGRAPGPKDVPPTDLLRRISTLIHSGLAPTCRVVLVERLRSAIGGERPFDPREPKQEPALLDQLILHLKDENGELLGGAAMEEAIAHRRVRQRQAILRAEGINEVADRLQRR